MERSNHNAAPPESPAKKGTTLRRSDSIPLSTSSSSSSNSNSQSKSKSNSNNGYPFKRYLSSFSNSHTTSLLLLNERTAKAEAEAETDREKEREKDKDRDREKDREKEREKEKKREKEKCHAYTLVAWLAAFCFALHLSALLLIKNADLVSFQLRSESLTSSSVYVIRDRTDEYRVKFVPSWKFREIFGKQSSSSSSNRMRRRRARSSSLALRHPRLALVCSNLEYTPEAMYLITIGEAIQALGYKLELYAFEDGPMRDIWKKLGIPCNLIMEDEMHRLNVDWLNFEGVLASSLSSKVAVSSLMQEPFKRVPVLWIIFEATLGQRLRNYEAAGWMRLVSEWRDAFKRAESVIFPNHALAMLYSVVDTGNFLVIPGSPVELWEADQFMVAHNREDLRKYFGLRYHDIAVAVVGSPFTYKEAWREHALMMRSFLPVIEAHALKEGNGYLKLHFLGGGLTCDYESALQAMAHQFGLIDGTVSYHCGETDINSVLWASDFVIYSSLRGEQAFPDVLTRAMAFGKLIIAPNNTLFQNHITDGVNGFLYEYGNAKRLSVVLTKAILEVLHSNYIRNISMAARAKSNALFVDEVVRGYAELLDSMIQVPSEMLLPKYLLDVPEVIPKNWSHHLFKDFIRKRKVDATVSDKYVEKIPGIVVEMEIQFNKTFGITETSHQSKAKKEMDVLSRSEWLEEKTLERIADIEQHEEDELIERLEMSRNSWGEVYRSAKRVERARDELHERDDGELERTGQILCIYEPYLGSGAWPFLRQSDSLYRGLSLSSKQRRPSSDDIDAGLRLPLVKNSYYRDVLCEFRSFLALGNRIDRIHKNPWIGFQSWRAKGQKVALSTDAEKTVLEALHLRTHGDSLYFWANLEDAISPDIKGIGSTVNDFWSYCDAVNNNNCRAAFSDAFKHMYGITSSWSSLPPMPSHTGTWALLNCWIMPTSSFQEFVMFSRMFIDALDSKYYEEHTKNGKCFLGITSEEVRHCYCRVLELLVNVWAYHSGRRMIYVDPNTGSMHEHHSFETRRDRMWIKFMELSRLKSMDEDMAEEAANDDDNDDGNDGDDDGFQHHQVGRRWLWPHTGEIYSHRINEKERFARNGLKMERMRRNKERLERMRNRYRQRPLAGG